MTYSSLIAAVDTSTMAGLRNKIALLLMYRCGLTVAEVCILSPDEVDLPSMTLHIAMKPRTVPIPAEMRKLMAVWHLLRTESSWWLCGAKGQRMSSQYYRKVLRQLAAQVGFIGEAPSPVDLRLACAEEMLQRYPVGEVVTMLGYSCEYALAKGLGRKVSELRRCAG